MYYFGWKLQYKKYLISNHKTQVFFSIFIEKPYYIYYCWCLGRFWVKESNFKPGRKPARVWLRVWAQPKPWGPEITWAVFLPNQMGMTSSPLGKTKKSKGIKIISDIRVLFKTNHTPLRSFLHQTLASLPRIRVSGKKRNPRIPPLCNNGYWLVFPFSSPFLHCLFQSRFHDVNLTKHCAVTGISRDSMHKRRATGGKKKAWRKKRK